MAEFDQWLLAWRRREAPSFSQGRQLAAQRRSALKELIMLDPEEALARAVPRALRRQLPLEVQAELETPVDAFGRFEVIASCFGPVTQIERFAIIEDHRYQAHTYGRRLATLTKDRLAVHGIAVDDQLALSAASYRPFEPGELASGPGEGNGVFVAVGDKVQGFSSAENLAEWQRQVAMAESGPDPHADLLAEGPSAAVATWTLGEKHVLWVRVDYPEEPGSPISEAEIVTAAARIDQFFQDNSHGRCSMKSTVLPAVLRLPKKEPWCDLLIHAKNLAAAYDAEHGKTGVYDPYKTDRWIVYTSKLPELGNEGIGYLGESGLLLNAPGAYVGEVAVHELGHNHGLPHAHAWRGRVDAAVTDDCHVEYGDAFDVMGAVWAGETGFLRSHLNTAHKATLLFLDGSDVAEASTSGVYRLRRHDDRYASGIQALTIAEGAYEYWLEHRGQSPRNEPASLLERVRSGIQVRWGKHPSSLPGAGTYLIDASPLSTPGDFNDAPLALGETFTDTERCFSVTPVALGGSAPAEWIDVRVTWGATGTNRNPVLSLAPVPAVLPVRTDVTFAASANDPDGDPISCTWNFDLDHAPIRTTTARHRFTVGGDYTISCSVKDGRGGIGRERFTVHVEDPLRRWTYRGFLNELSSMYAVIHDGRQFVIVGSGWWTAITSPDGITWTKRGTRGPGVCYGVAHDGSRYVAAGTISGPAPDYATIGAIFVSTDLTAWTQPVMQAGMPRLTAIAHGAGRFVAVGDTGTILSSQDGTAWTTPSSGVIENLNSVHFAAGRFVVVGNAGVILTSTDGLTWQNKSVATDFPLWGIAYHRNQWIVGAGAHVYTSADTREWTKHAVTGILGPNPLVSLGDSQILLNAHSADLQVSEDGVIWNSFPIGSSVTSDWGITAACEHDGTVVAAGFDGLILQSSLVSSASGVPFSTTPSSHMTEFGGSATFAVAARGGSLDYRWYRNGAQVAAIGPELTVANVQPADAGVYHATITSAGGASVTSAPAILGLSSNAKALGGAHELDSRDIRHPNGNVFDQVLLDGSAAAITADHSLHQITRLSFIDLDDDIVQVEFSGPGTLTLVLDDATPPAAPRHYNQPNVSYMKGHASIVITGANENTNVGVFTVGRATAFDPTGHFDITKGISSANDPRNNGSPLFVGHDSTDYDGFADLAFIAISTTNGKFGGVRTSNATYFAHRGYTGVYAPGVTFQGPVFIGNIDAFDSAVPCLVVGSVTDARITGGDMHQTNDAAVEVRGIAELKFTRGADSHGNFIGPEINRAKFIDNGDDVTARIVVYPLP